MQSVELVTRGERRNKAQSLALFLEGSSLSKVFCYENNIKICGPQLKHLVRNLKHEHMLEKRKGLKSMI